MVAAFLYSGDDPSRHPPAAFQTIVDTLPGNVNVENQRAPNGDVYVWLDRATVAKLKALRGPGEDYSDVILKVSAGAAS